MLIHNGYMYLYDDKGDIITTRASRMCQAWGGNLASITSREESLFVSSNRLTHTGSYKTGLYQDYLIGLFSNYTRDNCPVCADGTCLCNVDTKRNFHFLLLLASLNINCCLIYVRNLTEALIHASYATYARIHKG